MQLAILTSLNLIVLTAVFGWGWSNPETDVHGLVSIMFVLLIFPLISQITQRIIKEKKDRLIAQLPVKLSYISIAKQLYIILFWLLFVALFSFGFLVFRSHEYDSWILYYLISVTGLVISVNTWSFIHRDLLFLVRQKYQKIIITLFYIILTAVIIILYSSGAVHRYFPNIPVDSFLILMNNFSQFSATPIGAITVFLAAVCFFITGVFIYRYRKSFLE